MEFNRTENVSKSFITGIITKVISILLPFAIRTIIIIKLGKEYLGLNSLFTSVLNILSISELGIGSAISFCLYKPIAEDNKEEINALLSLLKKLYKYVGIVLIFGGIIIMPFINYLINSDIPSDINIYIIYALFLINSAVSYLGFAYKRTLLVAYQKEYLINKIELLVEIIKCIIQILVLILFSNYVIYIVILPLTTILSNILIQIVSKKTFPDLYPKGTVSNETKNIVKRKVIYLSSHKIASSITNSIDAIVITSSLGLAAMSVYGNYSYITSAIFAFILIAYRSLLPAVGNSMSIKTQEENKRIFDTIFFMSNWLGTWCAVCLLCLFQPFITIWLGKDFLLSIECVVMISAFFYSNAIRHSIETLVSAAGMWNKTLPRQILAAFLNLLLAIILVKKYSIAGIIFASFFVNAFISLPMDIIVAYKYILKKDIKEGIFKTIIYFLIAIIIGFITYYVCSLVNENGIVELLIKALICLLIPNIIGVVISWKKHEFSTLLLRIKSLIKSSWNNIRNK